MGTIITKKSSKVEQKAPPFPVNAGAFKALEWAYVPGSAELGNAEWDTALDLCSIEGQELLDCVFGPTGPTPGEEEAHQRTIDRQNLANMLADVVNGRWVLTGQPCIFVLCEGRIQSGDCQHRAVVSRQALEKWAREGMKGKRPTMPCTLIFHCRPDVFSKIDQGKARSARDNAVTSGIPRELAGDYATAVGHLVARCEGKGRRYESPFSTRLPEFVEHVPRLVDSVRWAWELEQSVRSCRVTATRKGLDGVLLPSQLCGVGYLAALDCLLGYSDLHEGQEKIESAYVKELAYDAGILVPPAESFETRQRSFREFVQQVCWGEWPILEFRKKGSIGSDGRELASDCFFHNGKPIAIKDVLTLGETGGIIGEYRTELERELGRDTPASINSRIDAVVIAFAAWSNGAWPKAPLNVKGKPIASKSYPRFRSDEECGIGKTDEAKKGRMSRLGGYDCSEDNRGA